MRLFPALVASATFLSGCFLSSGSDECTAFPSCDSGTYTVAACEGIAGCYETSLCGATISCAPEAVCGAIPVCDPGETELPGCRLGPDCRQVTMCGTTIYCAQDECPDPCPLGSAQVEVCSDAFSCFQVSDCRGELVTCEDRGTTCDAIPVCPPETIQVSSCDPDDPACSRLEVCDSVIYCMESPICESVAPCTAAASTVVASGPGGCPPESIHCVEEVLCSETYFCDTACPPGVLELSGPGDCVDGLCEVFNVGGTLHWCESTSDCFGLPVCNPGEMQRPVDEPCDDASICRFETVCGLTIQCVAPAIVAG